MRELVESIAKALVDNPDEVGVTAVEGEETTVCEAPRQITDYLLGFVRY